MAIGSDGAGCDTPPLCTITPSGPLSIGLGESVFFTVCGESGCDNDDDHEITVEAIDRPDWCATDRSRGNGGGVGNACKSYACTPPAAGMYTLRFRVTAEGDNIDLSSGDGELTSMCSIVIVVDEPMCMEPPVCEFLPDGPIKITAGETEEILFCFDNNSECMGNAIIFGLTPMTTIPSFCDLSVPMTDPNTLGGLCVTITCSPTADDIGMHEISLDVTDVVNGQTTTCSIMIEVNEPMCMEPPTCEITPSDSLKIIAGETGMFTICWASSCNDVQPGTHIQGLPSYCTLGPITPEGNGVFCRTITCSPGVNDVGMESTTFTFTDNENGQTTTCSIMIEVNAPMGCQEPPLCTINPTGPVKITLGDSVNFEICGQSLCDDFVDIEPVNPPAWCGIFRSGGDESCIPVNCTPPTAGMHTLTFRVTDTSNDRTTECSITIEVNEECMEPPTCAITPTGPIKITLGETVEFEVCSESLCSGTPFIDAINQPDWCEQIQILRGGTCETYRCTPPAAGMYELQFNATDDANELTTTCSIMIEVNEPCDDLPTCSITPPGPLKVVVGESVEFEVCGESQCGNTVDIIPIDVPAWCGPVPNFVDAECVLIRCTPPADAVGMHTLTFQITDDVNAQSEFCTIIIEVNEPCIEPPTCTVTPPGPITAYVGEEFSFEVCGESHCDDGEIYISTLNKPEWCDITDIRYVEDCINITCTPPNNVEGMYTFEFEIEDTSNGEKTTCSIDVEVVCHLEPMCFFTEDGPYTVAVGEEIDFEFCGVTVCDGHRTRIEMKSRPPFIEPAGHLKGGENEELCLPIKGTPGPGDVGSWRVFITTKDIDTGVETQCQIRIIVTGPPQCDDRPACSITPENDIVASAGDSVMIEVCGASLCDDGAAMIELVEAPGFCDPFETVIGESDEEVCAELTCVIPDDAEPGEYRVRFRITDLENDRFRFCETTIVIEEPDSLTFCVEEEPNDDFTTCTLLDTNDCLDLGCGSNVVGLLSLNGIDLDYYCLSGLEPFTDYLVTVVGGIDCNGAPVCAALACLDENGNIINSTNSGGVMMGYPSINCVSDASGNVQIAVSGCDDLDFDGQPDNPDVERLGGIGHGSTGSYQMTVVPLNPVAVDIACHADMNGDGVVDTGDLGILLDVFGEICAP